MVTNFIHTHIRSLAIAVATISLVGVGGWVYQAHAATSTIPLCEITRNLTIGDSGEDVQCLQRYLNWSGFTVATTGAGSPGYETMYYGSLTAHAVARWQDANRTQVLAPLGLSAGTGYWGRSSFDWYVKIVRTQLGV